MDVNGSILLSKIGSSSKNNANRMKGSKPKNDAFGHIFENSKKYTSSIDDNCRSKQSFEKIKESTRQTCKYKTTSNMLDDNNSVKALHNNDKKNELESNKTESTDKSSNEYISDKIGSGLDRVENDDDLIEQDVIDLESDKILQYLKMLDGYLQNISNTHLELTQNDVNSLQDNMISGCELNMLCDELRDKVLNVQDSIKLSINQNQEQSLEFIQDIQKIIDMLDNIDVQDEDFLRIKEMIESFDKIIDPIQDISQPVINESQNFKQSKSDKFHLADEIQKSIFTIDEKTLDKTDSKHNNISNIDNQVNAKQFVDNINIDTENTKDTKISGSFVFDQSIKFNEQIIDASNAISTSESNTNKISNINKYSIFEQITDKIKVNYKGLDDEIRIRLRPESLGEMTIKVVIEKGVVTAKAVVENYNIKQLLDSNIEQLKDSFKEQGIAFQALDVSVNKDSEFDRNNAESWANSKKLKSRNIKLDETKISDIYEEANVHNTNTMYINPNGLDLIV